MRISPLLLIIAFTLMGCNQPDADQAGSQVSTPENVAPNTVNPAQTEASSDKQYHHDANVINFEGFGPAKFGGNEESVRMSWGRPLLASTPAVGATCYYLYKEPTPALNKTHQRGIAFMFEDGQFVRYDIDDTSFVAPGDIVVGDPLDKILSVYKTFTPKILTEVQPHKYIEGAKTVIVSEAELTETRKTAKLIFELDAQDKVIQWRIGIAPQVYYVEGCS